MLLLCAYYSSSYSKNHRFGQLVAFLSWFLVLGTIVVETNFLIVFQLLESHSKEAYWKLFDSFLLFAPSLTAMDHVGVSMYECKGRAAEAWSVLSSVSPHM